MTRKLSKEEAQSTDFETKLPMVTCPKCHYGMDAASPFLGDERRPQPHDFALCMQCAQICTYADDFTLLALPDEDFSLLPLDIRGILSDAVKAVLMVKKILRERGGPPRP